MMKRILSLVVVILWLIEQMVVGIARPPQRTPVLPVTVRDNPQLPQIPLLPVAVRNNAQPAPPTESTTCSAAAPPASKIFLPLISRSSSNILVATDTSQPQTPPSG